MDFSRNLGLISEKQQNLLSNASVLIAGVGGMGGVAAEVLVRMGLGKLKIIDPDIYEASNSNRQIHCDITTLGKPKVEATKDQLLKINPNLDITSYQESLDIDNVNNVLEGVDYVINGMDRMRNSLILERTARKMSLTIVDAWLTPYASVFVMTPDAMHWEEYLDLPTLGVSVENLTDEMCDKAVEKEVEYTFSKFTPYDVIEKQRVIDVIQHRAARPSLAPVVWLSGVMMANEVMKLITGQSHTDHKGIFYNQYSHEVM